jgi:Ca2+-binding RTX toxin-like protein
MVIMPAVALGSEFIVNAVAVGNQYRPSITKLASGGFAIAWQDTSGQGSVDLSDDVRFARYDAFGMRLNAGTDTLANTTTASSQFEVSAAAYDNGKFVLAWTDASETAPDFDNRAVRFQIFNADGTKSGTEKIANTIYPLSQDKPSVAVLTGGNIIVTWTSDDINASSTENVIRRVFDSSGSPLTGEAVINTQTVGDQSKSTVHALSTGGFAVVWEDREDSATTGFQTKTFIRFYSSGGTASGAPVVANTSTAGDPQEAGFAELSNGKIVLTWSDFDPLGTGDGSGYSVRARIYDPASATFGAAINVNATTSFDQSDAQVAALDNGQFVVVWSDLNTTAGPDTSFGSVKLQVFNSAGAKVGGEVLVNSNYTFEQANPVVTVLDDFRFVVAWEDNSHTGSDTLGYAIHSRIFDARIAGITLDGDSANNDYQGSNFGDTIKGFNGNDRINGGGGIDFLFGGIGNDVLDGESGNDQLDGGDGNDTYYVDSATDIVIEAPGGGTDYIYATVSYAIAANVERLYLLGTSALNATGRNAQNDILVGNSGNNILDGLSGYDLMRGGTGNDTYYVDHASDTTDEVNSGGGTSDYVYASVSFTAAAGIERLYLSGSSNINATGSNGQADILVGNGGNNILDGKSGNDLMRGGLGNDTYYVDSVSDTTDEVNGGGGSGDYVYASVNFTAAVGIERLFLTGATAINGTGRDGQNDIIFGNSAGNTLTGLTGNDVLIGGLGNDTLTGGAGLDIFRFDSALNAASNTDFISDFAAADDTIQLDNAIMAALGSPGALSANMFKDMSLDVLDADDRIYYNPFFSSLYYDADGVGGVAAVRFAVLLGSPTITAADFFVI